MFPALYHAHHSSETEDITFWVELAGEAHQPVLELGCGTGRVLIPLARAGHPVTGIDLDIEMLLFLQEQLPSELKPSVQLIQADMGHFRLVRLFPRIFMPCNTFSTLTAAERRSTLENIRRHLTPDGIFSASMPNPQVLMGLPRRGETEIEAVLEHPFTGNPVQVSSTWVRSRQFFTITWFYDHLFPDGRVERASVAVQHSLEPFETYIQDFRQAELKVNSILGDFDRSEYHSDSPYLILIVRPT